MKEKTIGTREIAEKLGRDHSNVKISAKRRLGLKYCESLKTGFKTSNGNRYFEYRFPVGVAEDLISQLSIRSKSVNHLESCALSTIEQVLNITLIKQYRVLNYSIDGYHEESNTAYEIDEEYHYDSNGNLKRECVARQKEIEKELGCKFVRIKV